MFILFSPVISSCSLFSIQASLTVVFPPGPLTGAAVSLAAWRLEYPVVQKDGTLSFIAEEYSLNQLDDSGALRLEIDRGVNLPLLAFPVFMIEDENAAYSFSGNFPAGAFYPADADGDYIELHWDDGFACETVMNCYRNTESMSAFNIERFRESIDVKTEGLSGGCWNCDPETVLSRLAYGVFRESAIQLTAFESFPIEVCGGIYHSDNHLLEAIDASGITGSGLIEFSAAEGRKTAFINTESGEVVEVYYSESFWCWRNLYTGAVSSGRR